jgi:hypothetical protein
MNSPMDKIGPQWWLCNQEIPTLSFWRVAGRVCRVDQQRVDRCPGEIVSAVRTGMQAWRNE